MKIFRVMGLLILIVLFFTSVVTYAQSPAEEIYYQGVEFAIQGKFKKAKEEFEKALKVDQFYAPAEQSLIVFQDVIEQKIKREAAIYFFKAISYVNKGLYDQAISGFTKAIEINPGYAMPYYNRGTAYVNKGQYDKAISDLTKVIEINPSYVENAYLNRGVAYVNKGQHDQAISDYTKAIEINPKYADAYYNRGLSYKKNRKNDKDISEYTKAIEINPKYANAYYDRGLAYDDKGKYNQVISDYTKAIEINPKYADAYDNRGFTYFVNLGDKNRGCTDFKQACELGECRNYSIVKRRGDCK